MGNQPSRPSISSRSSRPMRRPPISTQSRRLLTREPGPWTYDEYARNSVRISRSWGLDSDDDFFGDRHDIRQQYYQYLQQELRFREPAAPLVGGMFPRSSLLSPERERCLAAQSPEVQQRFKAQLNRYEQLCRASRTEGLSHEQHAAIMTELVNMFPLTQKLVQIPESAYAEAAELYGIPMCFRGSPPFGPPDTGRPGTMFVAGGGNCCGRPGQMMVIMIPPWITREAFNQQAVHFLTHYPDHLQALQSG